VESQKRSSTLIQTALELYYQVFLTKFICFDVMRCELGRASLPSQQSLTENRFNLMRETLVKAQTGQTFCVFLHRFSI
jgi:hypothetical protein